MNEIRNKYCIDYSVNIDIWVNHLPIVTRNYVLYLEGIINNNLEQKRQDADDRIYRLGHGNFIMRVRHLASVQELDDWDEKYKTFVESIPPDRYSEFLSLYENDGLKRVMDAWL